MSILICYDGSPSARHALVAARATLMHERSILLHVWNPPETHLADAFSAAEGDNGPAYSDLEAASVGRSSEVLEIGRQLATQLGFQVELHQKRKDSTVWGTILAVADELDAASIVVGTHGTTAMQSALLGSVSSAVAHHSRRPVLLVPAGNERLGGFDDHLATVLAQDDGIVGAGV